MTRFSTARFDLPKALALVAGGERVMLASRGKNVAAIVSVEDLREMEEMEDRLDADALDNAKQEWEKSGRKTVTLEEAKKRLGL